jgi:hypothetical protein
LTERGAEIHRTRCGRGQRSVVNVEESRSMLTVKS